MSELTLMQRVLKISNELKVKKNGKNTFSKYDYFKLEDIMDALKPMLFANNVFLHYDITQNDPLEGREPSFRGTLTLFDAVNQNDKIVFVADIERAEVKGASGIQMSGATQTYGKRQAVMNAFGISEEADDPNNDENDSRNPKNVQKQEKKPVVEKATGADAVQSILDTFKPMKVVREDFERKYSKPMEELTEKEFSEIRKIFSELKKHEKTKEELFA